MLLGPFQSFFIQRLETFNKSFSTPNDIINCQVNIPCAEEFLKTEKFPLSTPLRHVGKRGMTPLILNLCTRQEEVANFRAPADLGPVLVAQKAGWALEGLWTFLEEKNYFPTWGFKPRNFQPVAEWLYRLHYSGCLSIKQRLRSYVFNWLNTNRDKGLPNSDNDVISNNKVQAYDISEQAAVSLCWRRRQKFHPRLWIPYTILNIGVQITEIFVLKEY